MNKKNLLSFIIKLFIVIIIGYIVGFIYNNYRLIRNHNDIGIININYDNISYNGFEEQGDKLVSNSENPYIIYSVENPIFINKLLLDYNIDNNVDWNIDYVYENYYGILEEDNIKGTANKYINIYSEYIKKKVTSIKLTFNSNNKISIENIRLDNNIIYLSSNYIFFLIIFISSFILFYFRKIFKNKIEWIFVIIALSFGIVVLSVHEISIGKSWDDQIHFDNSYGMSTEYYNSAANSFSDNYGNFLTNDFKKFNTPEEIDAFKNYLSKQQFENSNYKSQVIFDYNKITYLPQNIIFFLGNLLKIPFNLQFTLAMAINLIIYVVIVFFAIRKTPCGKYLMLVIGLIPTTLFMASSFSYDPALTAFMLLGISYFLFEYKNKDKINAKNIGIIVISFILASCIKAVYAPIILILLMLPKKKFSSDKKCKYFKILTVIMLILLMSTFLLPLLTNTMASDARGGDTDVTSQLKLIIKSPISFARVYIDYPVKLFLYKFFDADTFFNFAYLNVLKNYNCYYLFLFLLIFSIFVKNENIISKKHKIIYAIILFFIYSFIWGSLYLLFTPVGAVTMNGVQNRYFIPILFSLLSLFSTNKIRIDIKEDKLYIIYCILLSISIYSAVYYVFIK